jgi:hypothetical protein
MRFGTWNLRSLHRAGSLKRIVSKMAKYNLNTVAVQGTTWAEGGSQLADRITFFHGNGNTNHHLETGCFVHNGITSAVKEVDLISDRMYITLRSYLCDTVQNIHAKIEDKNCNIKDSFYKELDHVFISS